MLKWTLGFSLFLLSLITFPYGAWAVERLDCNGYLDPNPVKILSIDPRISEILKNNPQKIIAVEASLLQQYWDYYPTLFKLLNLQLFTDLTKARRNNSTNAPKIILSGSVEALSKLFPYLSRVQIAKTETTFDIVHYNIKPILLRNDPQSYVLTRSGLSFRRAYHFLKETPLFTHLLNSEPSKRDEVLIFEFEFYVPVSKMIKRLSEKFSEMGLYILNPMPYQSQPHIIRAMFLEGAQNPQASLDALMSLPSFFRGYAFFKPAKQLAEVYNTQVPLLILIHKLHTLIKPSQNAANENLVQKSATIRMQTPIDLNDITSIRFSLLELDLDGPPNGKSNLNELEAEDISTLRFRLLELD